MKEVIYINEVKGKEEKPVEFTHFLIDKKGWVEAEAYPEQYNKVVYLGKSDLDGDLFAAYGSKDILIYKGHLNSGKY